MNQTVITYLSVYSIALWINFIGCVTTGKFSGDLTEILVEIDNYELLLLALIHQVLIIIAFFIFKFFIPKKIILGNIIFQINKKKLSKLIFFFIIIHGVYFLTTDIGRALGTARSPYSPLFSLIAPINIFYFYYLFTRSEAGILFTVNIILYSLIESMKGWSGFFLFFAFFELYFYVERNKDKKILKTPFLFSLIIPVFFLVVGGVAYKHIYVFKNERRGIDLQKKGISYYDAIRKLTDRLSNFSVSAGIYSRLESAVIISKKQDDISEIKGFFRPILPKFIMENKNFRGINNTTMLAFFPDYSVNAAVDIGFFMYYWVLFKTQPLDAFFSLLFTVILFLGLACFYKIISNNQRSVDFLIFIMLFSIVHVANIEVVFSGGFLKTVLFIPFLIFCTKYKILKHKM